jgi:hypothetical protein
MIPDRACASRILSGLVRPRAVRAIARDRGDHEPGIDRAQHRRPDPQPVRHAGAKVLDDHIRALGKPLDRRDGTRLFQVKREAFLAPVDRVKQRRIPAKVGVRQIQLPGQIAGPRTLDLDHAGPQIGQPQAAIGAGQELAHVEHQKAIKGGCRVHRVSSCPRYRPASTGRILLRVVFRAFICESATTRSLRTKA